MKTVEYNATQASSYDFTSTDKLFFDTNIWLYLYSPSNPSDYEVNIYSEVFNRILKAQSQIYIDFVVVSEFINAYARIKWRFVGENYPSYKEFRNNPFFKMIASDIVADAKRVVGHCQVIKNGSTGVNINELLDDFTDGVTDFNDQLILEVCKRHSLTLITHDKDFNTNEIPVITANRTLLKK